MLQSTDEHWRPTHVDRSKRTSGPAPPIFKYIELNHLGAYWNPTDKIEGCNLDLATCSVEDFSEVFRSMIPRRNEPVAREQNQLLKPVDAEAKLQLSRSQQDTSKPQMRLYVATLDSCVGECAVTVVCACGMCVLATGFCLCRKWR